MNRIYSTNNIIVTAATWNRFGRFWREKLPNAGGLLRMLGEAIYSPYKQQMNALRIANNTVFEQVRDLDDLLKNLKKAQKGRRDPDIAYFLFKINDRFEKIEEAFNSVDTELTKGLEDFGEKHYTDLEALMEVRDIMQQKAEQKQVAESNKVDDNAAWPKFIEDIARRFVFQKTKRKEDQEREIAVQKLIGNVENIIGSLGEHLKKLSNHVANGDIGKYIDSLAGMVLPQTKFQNEFSIVFEKYLKKPLNNVIERNKTEIEQQKEIIRQREEARSKARDTLEIRRRQSKYENQVSILREVLGNIDLPEDMSNAIFKQVDDMLKNVRDAEKEEAYFDVVNEVYRLRAEYFNEYYSQTFKDMPMLPPAEEGDIDPLSSILSSSENFSELTQEQNANVEQAKQIVGYLEVSKDDIPDAEFEEEPSSEIEPGSIIEPESGEDEVEEGQRITMPSIYTRRPEQKSTQELPGIPPTLTDPELANIPVGEQFGDVARNTELDIPESKSPTTVPMGPVEIENVKNKNVASKDYVNIKKHAVLQIEPKEFGISPDKPYSPDELMELSNKLDDIANNIEVYINQVVSSMPGYQGKAEAPSYIKTEPASEQEIREEIIEHKKQKWDKEIEEIEKTQEGFVIPGEFGPPKIKQENIYDINEELKRKEEQIRKEKQKKRLEELGFSGATEITQTANVNTILKKVSKLSNKYLSTFILVKIANALDNFNEDYSIKITKVAEKILKVAKEEDKNVFDSIDELKQLSMDIRDVSNRVKEYFTQIKNDVPGVLKSLITYDVPEEFEFQPKQYVTRRQQPILSDEQLKKRWKEYEPKFREQQKALQGPPGKDITESVTDIPHENEDFTRDIIPRSVVTVQEDVDPEEQTLLTSKGHTNPYILAKMLLRYSSDLEDTDIQKSLKLISIAEDILNAQNS